jgi:hypothetical protein
VGTHLGGEFSPFFGKIFWKKNIILHFLGFLGTQFARKRKENPKEPSKLSQLPNIYEWVLKIFLLSCF